jgi:hypothetical protein
MKMTFGRKFWGCIVGLILLTAIVLILLETDHQALTEDVILLYMGLIVILTITYIGGNVLTKWIGVLKDIKPGINIGK